MTPEWALDIWADCRENEDGDWKHEAMRRIINETLEQAATVLRGACALNRRECADCEHAERVVTDDGYTCRECGHVEAVCN